MAPKLLATPARWSLGTAVLGGLAWAFARALPAWIGAERERPLVAAAAWAVLSVAFWLYLRGEESRLSRELRVARSGTSIQRRTLLRRRRPAPYFGLAMFWYAAVRVLAALASTTLGVAAVLVAEGEIGLAEASLRGIGQALSFGDLRALRVVVEADVSRAHGTEASLADSIQALVALPPLPETEAERYRIHVLVKALLQQGDDGTARDIAEQLQSREDEELRVYVVWMQTWFEWTHLAPPAEAEVRLATLLARTHGADDLVARLEACARPLPEKD